MHTRNPAPLSTVARWLGLPLVGFLRAPGDVRRYTWHSGACLLALYGLLLGALANGIPPWILLLLVPPLYVRSALSVHELMHARSERQVPLLHRMMMVLESPVSLGYREHRDIHIRHHRYCVSDADPEMFQIRGGHARALVGAMLSPEWGLVKYVRDHGVSRMLAWEASARGAAFVAACVAHPLAFLYYWVALRLSIGLSAYAFHHALHQRDGVYGTYALTLSPTAERLLGAVIGRECVHILTEHPAHHAWQGVRAECLPTVAPALAAAALGTEDSTGLVVAPAGDTGSRA